MDYIGQKITIFVIGLMIGSTATIIIKRQDYSNIGYTKGIIDSKKDEVNFIITTTPEGTDTTYIYKLDTN